MRVDWTREALLQFDHQHSYLAQRSQQAADRMVRDAKSAMELIGRNPEFGKRVGPRMREWGLGRSKQFVLRYVVESVVVLVVEFWHTAQLRPTPDASDRW